MSNNLIIIMCPPYPEYTDVPEDHSHSELLDCPKCGNKMWLSEKKKGIILFNCCLKNEIILGCYPCIKNVIGEDPSSFMDHEVVNV